MTSLQLPQIPNLNKGKSFLSSPFHAPPDAATASPSSQVPPSRRSARGAGRRKGGKTSRAERGSRPEPAGGLPSGPGPRSREGARPKLPLRTAGPCTLLEARGARRGSHGIGATGPPPPAPAPPRPQPSRDEPCRAAGSVRSGVSTGGRVTLRAEQVRRGWVVGWRWQLLGPCRAVPGCGRVPVGCWSAAGWAAERGARRGSCGALALGRRETQKKENWWCLRKYAAIKAGKRFPNVLRRWSGLLVWTCPGECTNERNNTPPCAPSGLIEYGICWVFICALKYALIYDSNCLVFLASFWMCKFSVWFEFT